MWFLFVSFVLLVRLEVLQLTYTHIYIDTYICRLYTYNVYIYLVCRSKLIYALTKNINVCNLSVLNPVTGFASAIK